MTARIRTRSVVIVEHFQIEKLKGLKISPDRRILARGNQHLTDTRIQPKIVTDDYLREYRRRE
jgi:hypothetical protein